MQKDSLFITCARHLEPLLYEELQALNVQELRLGYSGVFAEKTMDTVYVVNYLSRLATRVLWPLHAFHCEDRAMLYREAKKVPWLRYIDVDKTFSIDGNVSHPQLRHSLFAAQIVKDALCDCVRKAKGERPSVDVKQPDVQFHLFIHNKRAIISLDTSGMPLYKRGWKVQRGQATMPETLAAALLKLAKYTPEHILCDPFCGTGTLLIEAACMATYTPAGFFRKTWGFLHMPEHTPKKWAAFRQVYDAKRIPLAKGLICGADKDLSELSLCRAHLAKWGWVDAIELAHKEIFSYKPPHSPQLILTDPPFGKRLSSFQKTYEELGLFLRNQCAPSAKVFILTPDAEILNPIGLPLASHFPLMHGGLDMALHELQLT